MEQELKEASLFFTSLPQNIEQATVFTVLKDLVIFFISFISWVTPGAGWLASSWPLGLAGWPASGAVHDWLASPWAWGGLAGQSWAWGIDKEISPNIKIHCNHKMQKTSIANRSAWAVSSAFP